MTVPVIYGLVFGSGILIAHWSYLIVFKRVQRAARVRAERASRQLDDMFIKMPVDRLQGMYLWAPIAMGIGGWVLSGSWIPGAIGFVAGFVVPQMVLKQLKALRWRKFHDQLVDSLMLLSSCLRAGLSLLQSFTVVQEEMPAPASEEFGLVLKETRMGVGLNEALTHFRDRMKSDDTTLFVTAMLVARETGGNVTAIFTRLVETLRERKKIRERIKTLTFMARLQGVMMGLLPIAFCVVIYRMDPTHLEFFMQDPDGRLVLAGVFVIQTLGMFLFVRFSRSPL